MMSESQYVVLIITCNLEKFRERRRLQANTVKCLTSEGFEVYYLMGNPDKNETLYRVQPNFEGECPVLLVPVEECYENLSLKVYYGYTYFLNRDNLKGILKLDDDTNFNNPLVPQFLKYISDKFDYSGLRSTLYKESLDDYHIKRRLKHHYLYTSLIRMNTKNINYFSGSFYWISKKVIEFIRINKLAYISEDISVGEIVYLNILPERTLIFPEEIKKLVDFDKLCDILKSKNVVYPFLRGGLCNRIFQILAALQYANQNNLRCVIHTSPKFSEPNPHPPKDKTLNMLARLFPNVEISNNPNINEANIIAIKYDDGFKYEKIPYYDNKDIIISGFFQCDKFFDKLNVLEHLNIGGICGISGLTESTNMFFLHVRLGDYLFYKDIHYIDLLPYYNKCIHKILDNPTTPDKIVILVFTNELGELFDNIMNSIYKSSRIEYKIQNPNDMPDRTLYLMSLCYGGAVCANSSLSWMGSMLIHENTKKFQQKPQIYMPSQWINFVHGNIPENSAYIYPEWAEIVSISD